MRRQDIQIMQPEGTLLRDGLPRLTVQAAPSHRFRLQGLTGLRGFGAIWVLIYHAQYGYNLPIAEAGFLGVDLFFILSGFVLSHAHNEFRWSWIGYWAFMRSRFARIFPLHWFALALVLLTLFLYPRIYLEMPQNFRWPELLLTALLVQNWGFGLPGPWNGPAWSLSTEWLVSIFFPIFQVTTRRVIRPGRATALCILCLGGFAVFLVLTHNWYPNVLGRAGIVRTICEFSSGCLLYRVYLANIRIPIVVAIAGTASALVGVLAPKFAILTVLAFPLLILSAAQPRGWVASVLSTPISIFLGETSFSIYLLHWILLQVSNRLQEFLELTGVLSLIWFLGYFLAVISFSAVTYYYVEVPARMRIRSRETHVSQQR